MRSEIGAIIKQYTPRDPRMESGVAGVPEMPTGPFTREGRRDNVTKAGAGAWHLACGQTHLMTTCHEIDPVLFVRPAAASFRLLSSARATAVGRGAGDPRHSAEQSSRACTMWQMSVNGQSRSFILRNRRAPPHAASGADLQSQSSECTRSLYTSHRRTHTARGHHHPWGERGSSQLLKLGSAP